MRDQRPFTGQRACVDVTLPMTTPGRQGRAQESTHAPEQSDGPDTATDGLLHTLLASAEAGAAAEAATTWQRRTSAGFTIRLRRADHGPDEVLELITPDGPLCLTIRLAKDGPAVEIHGAELHLHAQQRLRLEGEHVEVVAHKQLDLRSEGEIQQTAAGAVTSTAFEHQIEATLGEIRLTANDDVAVEGERIRLNSPMTPLPKHLKTPVPGDPAGNA